MSYGFDTRFGEHLYQLLPEVYRNRDKIESFDKDNVSQPLARYLDSQGHLLDLIHSTLEQQYKDAVPATSQDWLLPYFAKLLAANIISPDSKGRHLEVSNAIAWRQRKGTLKTVESIAESVGQIEVEIQEGWKRVVTTAKLDMPYRKMSSFDSSLDDIENPLMQPQKFARHPGMNIDTVDVRRPSRAVASTPQNPAGKLSRFGGIPHLWRQLNPNGVPCIPDGFDDVSMRTVDIRSTDRQGVYHHKNLLLFTTPSNGLFRLPVIELNWADRSLAQYKELFKEEKVNGTHYIFNISDRVVIIKDDANLTPVGNYHIEGIDFAQQLTADLGSYLVINNVQAKKVQVLTSDIVEPVVDAKHCLFEELSVGNGLAKIDNCTVLLKGYFDKVEIKNSIVSNIDGTNVTGRVEYSRIPELSEFSNQELTVEDSTSEIPLFFANQTELDARSVFAPGTSESILFGAIDKSEMGYFSQGRESRPVYIDSNFVGGDGFNLASADKYIFKDLIFTGEVEIQTGTFNCERSAFYDLSVNTPHVFSDGIVKPVMMAKDSIFEQLSVTAGLAQLEFVTVMSTLDAKYLRASDCIFVSQVIGIQKPSLIDGAPAFRNCIRYSKVPSILIDNQTEAAPEPAISNVALALGLITVDGKALLNTNTKANPIFNYFHYCETGIHRFEQADFGKYGYGVLNSLTSKKIRYGSEDRGEMGAYHYKLYSLRSDAVLKKIKEFLPVGIQPVLIEDSRLLHLPLETSLTTESTSGEGT